jgi:hypothetical protein
MYPMLQTLPDVVVHFAQLELNGAHNLEHDQMGQDQYGAHSGILDETFVDWVGSRPLKTITTKRRFSAAMDYVRKQKSMNPSRSLPCVTSCKRALMPGGKIISPYLQSTTLKKSWFV